MSLHFFPYVADTDGRLSAAASLSRGLRVSVRLQRESAPSTVVRPRCCCFFCVFFFYQRLFFRTNILDWFSSPDLKIVAGVQSISPHRATTPPSPSPCPRHCFRMNRCFITLDLRHYRLYRGAVFCIRCIYQTAHCARRTSAYLIVLCMRTADRLS